VGIAPAAGAEAIAPHMDAIVGEVATVGSGALLLLVQRGSLVPGASV
jgi:hypothetical protein